MIPTTVCLMYIVVQPWVRYTFCKHNKYNANINNSIIIIIISLMLLFGSHFLYDRSPLNSTQLIQLSLFPQFTIQSTIVFSFIKTTSPPISLLTLPKTLATTNYSHFLFCPLSLLLILYLQSSPHTASSLLFLSSSTSTILTL